MNSITVDQIMALRPCGWDGPNDGINYTRERVTELFAGREAITVADILDMPIPAHHRIWAWARVSGREIIIEFTCRCYERVAAPVWDSKFPGDNRPQKCVDAVRAFMRGEIAADELKKAAVAAQAAAESGSVAWAAWAAAGAAVWARLAVRLAGSAAESAAWAAAGAAVWARLAVRLAGLVAESAAWAATRSSVVAAGSSVVAAEAVSWGKILEIARELS